MNKSKILTALLISVIMLFVGCSSASNKLLGTWEADSIEIDGTKFTKSELEAMGDDSMTDIQIVIKEGGKAYLSEDGDGDIVDWSETEDGITIGVRTATKVDDMLCIEMGKGKVYFKKISDSQIIGEAQAEDTEAAGESETGMSEESKAEDNLTETTSANTENGQDEFHAICKTAEKDVEDTVAGLNEEYNNLLAEINTYDKYLNNIDKVEAFYSNVTEETQLLCIRLREYSIDIAEQIIASDIDDDEKYDKLDHIYDHIYDDAMDDIYDEVYDDLYDNLYDDIYDGVVSDASDDLSYDEYDDWSDTLSVAYEMWSDNISDIYDEWSDCSSDIYDFWSDLRSKIYNYDKNKERIDEIINDFREDIEKLKEKANENSATSETAEKMSSATEASTVSENIRPEFKEAMDSCIAFLDEYNAFEEKYPDIDNLDTSTMSDTEILAVYTDYLNLMAKLTDCAGKLSEFDEESLSDEEKAYYEDIKEKISEIE